MRDNEICGRPRINETMSSLRYGNPRSPNANSVASLIHFKAFSSRLFTTVIARHLPINGNRDSDAACRLSPILCTLDYSVIQTVYLEWSHLGTMPNLSAIGSDGDAEPES